VYQSYVFSNSATTCSVTFIQLYISKKQKIIVHREFYCSDMLFLFSVFKFIQVNPNTFNAGKLISITFNDVQLNSSTFNHSCGSTSNSIESHSNSFNWI